MNIERLLRIPGSRTPKEARTGNLALDNFLSEFDEHLLGSRKVRLIKLAEIKDHVIEKNEHYLRSGISEDAAAEKVIQSLGSPAELARPQREELKKKFIKISLSSGFLFGFFICLFFPFMVQIPPDNRLVIICLFVLGNAVLFGLMFGWMMTFLMPERELPSTARADGSSDEGSEFTVRFGGMTGGISPVLAIFFILLAVYYLTAGIAGSIDQSLKLGSSLPWWGCVIFGGICLFNFFALKAGSRQYIVTKDGILSEEFLGAKRFFSWDMLRRLSENERRFPLLPLVRTKYAEFQNEKNKPVRIVLHPQMLNADRLMILLEKRCGTSKV